MRSRPGALRAFVDRYVQDPTAPTKRSLARDIAVRGVLPALGLLGVACLVGEFALPVGPLGDEDALNRALQAARTPALDLVARVVSHVAGVVGAPLTALVAFFWIRRATRQWWLAWVPLIAVALEALVYQSAALLVARTRPEGVEQMDFGLREASFPSGHVGATACLVVVFALLAASYRRAWWLVAAGGAVWVLAVAASRLYLGMHHVTDAAGGLVIGVAAALIGWRVIRRAPGRHERPYTGRRS